MHYKCVKFHKNPISCLGGVALTRYMDGWTDGQGDSYIHPQTLFAGGIISIVYLTNYISPIDFRVRVRVMVFNATFNIISVIMWYSVLLAEDLDFRYTEILKYH